MKGYGCLSEREAAIIGRHLMVEQDIKASLIKLTYSVPQEYHILPYTAAECDLFEF